MKCKKFATECIQRIIAQTSVLENITLLFGVKKKRLVNGVLETLDDNYPPETEIDDGFYDWDGWFKSPEEEHLRYVKNKFPDVYAANYATPNLHDENISNVDFDGDVPDYESFDVQADIFYTIAHCCAETLTSLETDVVCDDSMPKVLQKCKQLASLNFSQITAELLIISDNIMESIGQFCPKLTSIDFNRCIFPIEQGIQTIAKGCNKITTLKLAPCRGIFFEHNPMFQFPGTSIATYMTQLSCIDLFGLKAGTDLDASLLPIFTHCKQLTDVNIGYTMCGDLCITAIAEHCVLINTLNIRHLHNMTTKALNILLTKCVNLTRFDLANNDSVDNSSIHCIGENLKKLFALKLHGCENMLLYDEDPTLALALKQCIKLWSVSLSYSVRDSIHIHYRNFLRNIKFMNCETVYDYLDYW